MKTIFENINLPPIRLDDLPTLSMTLKNLQFAFEFTPLTAAHMAITRIHSKDILSDLALSRVEFSIQDEHIVSCLHTKVIFNKHPFKKSPCYKSLFDALHNEFSATRPSSLTKNKDNEKNFIADLYPFYATLELVKLVIKIPNKTKLGQYNDQIGLGINWLTEYIEKSMIL